DATGEHQAIGRGQTQIKRIDADLIRENPPNPRFSASDCPGERPCKMLWAYLPWAISPPPPARRTHESRHDENAPILRTSLVCACSRDDDLLPLCQFTR